MRAMSRQFLENAFAGESQAHMKYLIFAEVAEKEGKPKIAKLFRAIAFAELVHARNHYRALGGVGNTVENLQKAMDGEKYEIEEMYPVYNATAKIQGEREAEKSTYYALSAEKIHFDLYSQAKKSAEIGKDLDIESVYICPICGHTAVNEVPDYCPICGAKRELFVKF
ncbi:MAG: rubrerythrin family protein [Archaeoglobaceae archaeon]